MRGLSICKPLVPKVIFTIKDFKDVLFVSWFLMMAFESEHWIHAAFYLTLRISFSEGYEYGTVDHRSVPTQWLVSVYIQDDKSFDQLTSHECSTSASCQACRD